QVQRQISDLRKLLGADAIETRAPGYVLRVDPDRLDLDRFERLTQDAVEALEGHEPQTAVDLLRRALELWRGAPLADLMYEALALAAAAPPAQTDETERTMLVAASDDERLDALLSLAGPVAALPRRTLIVARLLVDERDVEGAAVAVNARRVRLGDSVRTAAF